MNENTVRALHVLIDCAIRWQGVVAQRDGARATPEVQNIFAAVQVAERLIAEAKARNELERNLVSITKRESPDEKREGT